MLKAWMKPLAGAVLALFAVYASTVRGASLSDGSADGPAHVSEPLRAHLDALLPTLDPQAAATLARMPDPGRQLLAARSYLRAGPQIGERWSWSADQAESFAKSPERQALDAAIERVNCFFSAANPGYDLFVNPQFRSLDIQLQRWNDNASVARAASGLLTATQAAVSARDFPAARKPAGERRFAEWLRSWQPSPVPTLAAPGLSPHGQARAVDFQVRHAGRIVAGPVSASISRDWKASGWGQRLSVAITAAGGFTGPLHTPDEPWHYTYTPGQAGGSSPAQRCTR